MKHILITGGNAGIGRATAKALAQTGAKIILACRNSSKAEKTVSEIKRETGNDQIYSVACNLASFESIRTCVKTYKNQFERLDILINNAGVVTDKLKFTKEGFELQMGVNHLGHFLLTTQLIDWLDQSTNARIINVSSDAHYRGKINFNNFKGELVKNKFKGIMAYSNSKLANVLFTKELARRHPSITSHSLHPGVVGTQIAMKNNNGLLWGGLWKIFTPFMLSPAKGARTTIYLANSNEANKTNGNYFYKQKEKEPSESAQDEKLSAELWDVSTKLVAK